LRPTKRLLLSREGGNATDRAADRAADRATDNALSSTKRHSLSLVCPSLCMSCFLFHLSCPLRSKEIPSLSCFLDPYTEPPNTKLWVSRWFHCWEFYSASKALGQRVARQVNERVAGIVAPYVEAFPPQPCSDTKRERERNEPISWVNGIH
jgi:hypothetical protein